ncbi:MAG: hypothetical protein M1820_003804 [Bogoriella megaspora]|nr:MAG: hypothetical protein M1820_003804 [Bogoriella megaspora]
MASLTRVLASPLRSLGLGAAVAPSSSSGSTSGPSGLKGAFHVPRLAGKIRHCVLGGSGIAGGGLLEFEWRKAKAVLPLAVIYVAKIMLSNLSFAYAVYPIYILSRFAIIPLILVLTTFMNRETHSTSILTASLAAALSLEMASSRPGRVTWEAIVAGIASSIFAALYPVLIERTQRSLTSSLIPEGDLPSSSAQDSSSYDNPYRSNLFDDQSGTKEESRAYWQLLHYTSLLSLVILGALELISGEPFEIRHNCYFMDVPWFWFLILMSSLGAWSVFFATPLLIKATGPLSATFLSVPRGALQLVVLSSGKMPAHSWIGVSFCWAASLWFAAVRRYEGRILERIRLEGR